MTYIQPLTTIFLTLSILGLVQLYRGKRTRLHAIGIVGMLLLALPPVDWLLSRHLEARYPLRPFHSAQAEAIVVLGSAVAPPQYERLYPLPDKDTYQRCEYAAWLQRQWRSVPVLACGGRGSQGETVSASMRVLLQRAGVPNDAIWTEERSRSTYENALYGAELLRKHGINRIALVVEAQSMLRAEACFRKQGLTVVPSPSVFSDGFGENILPSWKAIERNEITLHETLGLAWYWLRDWI